MKEVFGSMAMDDTKVYTFDDIRDLPENVRAELIDGQIYNMAHPSTAHQILVTRLASLIDHYIVDKGGSCRVFTGPFGVYLDEKTNTFVEPDVCIVCDPGKIDSFGCNGAPDWVIEIVSPSSIPMDYIRKLFKYRTSGVREYWIVDPIKSRSLVYQFEKDTFDEYTFSDTVAAGIFEDLRIDFSKIELI